MNRQDQQNRRTFVLNLAKWIPGLALLLRTSSEKYSPFFQQIFLPEFTQPVFVSRYTIRLNHLDPHLFFPFRSRVAMCPFRELILPNMDSQWVMRYNNVRQFFINNGSLISSKKTLSAQGDFVSFINTWTSERTFTSYYHAAQLNYLDKKFRSAGCEPTLHCHTEKQTLLSQLV